MKKKKLLFLPFLQIPSGHHQVVKALIDGLLLDKNEFDCETVDILSYSYGKMEVFVSSVYLKWIQTLPGLYHKLYENSVYQQLEEDKRFRLYELLFLPFMRKLLKEKKPDLIVCSHALPSYMLNYLKEKKEVHMPVINVYTDYFIHRFWGVKQIDCHFVPTYPMKQFLLQKGVKENQIFVTGIPIHHHIRKQSTSPKYTRSNRIKLLLSGGNLGVGAMEDIIKGLNTDKRVELHVLCGKNERLFQRLQDKQLVNVIPYPFIDSRPIMDELYEQCDAVLTKPGGVTISECLMKRKPIFIFHALPGQEKINVEQLTRLGVIVQLNSNKSPVEQLLAVIENEERMIKMQQAINNYHAQLASKMPWEIIKEIAIHHGA